MSNTLPLKGFTLRILSALTLAGVASLAHAVPALNDPLPINPNLKVGKLDNGLTYYIQKNAKPAQRVELRLVVNAGSILEDEDQRGMAHFVEHMGFNGSTHFKKHELVAYLQSIGVRFGADLNASTGFDQTIYMLPVPTDKPGNLGKGLQVLEDWAGGMTLGSQEIEDERNIILEEKRLRAGAGMRTLEAMLPKLANGSRYKDRLPIGTEDSIAHTKPEAIRRFYTDWYRPDLMAVVIVGDIDPAEGERMVKEHFDHLKMPASPRPRPQFPLPPMGEPDALAYIDKEAPSNSVQLNYSLYQRKPASTVGDYRKDLVRRLFAMMMGTRFSSLTQVSDPPLVRGSAGEGGVPFGVNQRMYMASAAVGKAGVQAAIDALVKENERARQFGFTDSELDVAKRNLMTAYEHAYRARDTMDSAALLGQYVRNFLTHEGIPGIENEYEYAKTFVPGLTLNEINAYARETIPDHAPKLVMYTGNSAAGTAAPTREQLLADVASAQKLKVTKLDEKVLPANLMNEKPAPGGIVEQSDDKELGITKLVMSNGVVVFLKRTDFSKDALQMVAVRPGGQMLFPDADKNAVRFASAVQNAMGVAAYSPSDLQRMLAGRAISAGVSMGDYADQFSGSSRTEDLEMLLQLNYLKITNPRRDANLFRSFVIRNAEQVRNSRAVPDVRFAEARAQTVYGNHPRLQTMPRAEDFESLDLDRIEALNRARLSSAKGMTFFFVGDFDIEAVKPLLAMYVASLPVGDVALQYHDPEIRQVAGTIRKEFMAGVEQKSTVTYDFGGDLSWKKGESLVFRAMVDVLNIRITDELREKQKLIYSGGASGRYSKIPRGSYALSVQLPTSPQNVEKVETALWAEIDKLQSVGPSEEDLNKVKQAMLQGYRKSIRENGYWMGYLVNARMEDNDMHEILTMEQRINALTAPKVQEAAKRYLDKQKYVEMVLKPEV